MMEDRKRSMVSRIDIKKRRIERERRRQRRQRMLKHVQVLSLDKKAASAIDLTLRNASSSGAQLFGPAESLGRVPDEFYLVAPGQLRMIRCEVVWRADGAVGVSFLSDPGTLASREPEGEGGWEALEPEAPPPPENYVLDRTTGAVVKLGEPVSGAPDSAFRDLERKVSKALGLKVEIAGTGASVGRVVVHVRTKEQLNDVCRRLARRK
jgi:hypothetical protein